MMNVIQNLFLSNTAGWTVGQKYSWHLSSWNLPKHIGHLGRRRTRKWGRSNQQPGARVDHGGDFRRNHYRPFWQDHQASLQKPRLDYINGDKGAKIHVAEGKKFPGVVLIPRTESARKQCDKRRIGCTVDKRQGKENCYLCRWSDARPVLFHSTWGDGNRMESSGNGASSRAVSSTTSFNHSWEWWIIPIYISEKVSLFDKYRWCTGQVGVEDPRNVTITIDISHWYQHSLFRVMIGV